MRRMYATTGAPTSSPSASSSGGASTQRVAGMRRSRWGSAGRSAVWWSTSTGGRSSAGIWSFRSSALTSYSYNARAMRVDELPTPALVVDTTALDANLAAMSAALPGPRLRPHVKAHKCTALARRQAESGHRTFTCATPREMEGMARAGLGDDLLLANESVDDERLSRLAALDARVTVA